MGHGIIATKFVHLSLGKITSVESRKIALISFQDLDIIYILFEDWFMNEIILLFFFYYFDHSSSSSLFFPFSILCSYSLNLYHRKRNRLFTRKYFKIITNLTFGSISIFKLNLHFTFRRFSFIQKLNRIRFSLPSKCNFPSYRSFLFLLSQIFLVAPFH